MPSRNPDNWLVQLNEEIVACTRCPRLVEYREKIARVRELWPGISLSTDIIVGFCGETEEEFQHTLDLLEEI